MRWIALFSLFLSFSVLGSPVSAKTRQTARVSEELSSGRSNVEEFDLANQDFLDEESESLQDFVTNMKTLQLLSTPFSSSLREERQKRQQANCSGYVLDNECDCFLQNSRVGIPLQQVFFDQIAFPISEVRMLPAECRLPLLSFNCLLTFTSCEDDSFTFPCDACTRAEEECAAVGVPALNCTEIRALLPVPCSSALLTPLPESCPVTTCINGTGFPVECCPSPFAVGEDSGECVVSCPQYIFTKSKDEAQMWTFFVISWISIITVIICAIPQLLHDQYRALPQSIPVWLLFNYAGYLLMNNWGPYWDGYDTLCSYHESYPIALTLFLNDAQCRASAYLGTWFSFNYYFWFLMFTIRIFTQVYQKNDFVHSLFPNGFCTTNPQKIVVLSCVLIPANALSIGFFIYGQEHLCEVGDNECTISLSSFTSCANNVIGFSRYYYYVTILSIMSFCLVLMLFSLAKVLTSNFEFLILQWRFIAMFFIFLFTGMLTAIYSLALDMDKIFEGKAEYFGCTVATASNPGNCGDAESFLNFGLNLFVTIIVAIFPFCFCIVAYFSTEWFRHWWISILSGKGLTDVSTHSGTGGASSSSGETSLN